MRGAHAADPVTAPFPAACARVGASAGTLAPAIVRDTYQHGGCATTQVLPPTSGGRTEPHIRRSLIATGWRATRPPNRGNSFVNDHSQTRTSPQGTVPNHTRRSRDAGVASLAPVRPPCLADPPRHAAAHDRGGPGVSKPARLTSMRERSASMTRRIGASGATRAGASRSASGKSPTVSSPEVGIDDGKERAAPETRAGPAPRPRRDLGGEGTRQATTSGGRRGRVRPAERLEAGPAFRTLTNSSGSDSRACRPPVVGPSDPHLRKRMEK